jgi:hypothetical protein
MRKYPLMGLMKAQMPRDYGWTLEQENACCHAAMGIFMKKTGRLAVALQQSFRSGTTLSTPVQSARGHTFHVEATWVGSSCEFRSCIRKL